MLLGTGVGAGVVDVGIVGVGIIGAGGVGVCIVGVAEMVGLIGEESMVALVDRVGFAARVDSAVATLWLGLVCAARTPKLDIIDAPLIATADSIAVSTINAFLFFVFIFLSVFAFVFVVVFAVVFERTFILYHARAKNARGSAGIF